MTPRIAQGLVPDGAVAPPMRMFWLPLDTGGTTTGSTYQSGFFRRHQNSATTRDDDATLTVTSGTVSLQSVGGLKFNSGCNANLQVSPSSGDSLTFLQRLCDLSAFAVGQTLMIGAEIETPADWATAFVASGTILSVGSFGDGEGGGWGVGMASNERPTFYYRAVDATAIASPIVNLVGVETTGSLVDGARNVVIYEIQCTAENTFKARAHLSSSAGTTYTGEWSAETDLSDPTNGGTAAPGPVASAGIRIAGRKNLTTNENRLLRDEILRNVWIALFDAPPRESIGPKCCEDMLLRINCRPRTLTRYDADAVDIEGTPDGSYDAGFGILTLGDAFVAIDGKRATTDHPQFTIICETATSKPSNKSINIDSINPLWVSTADYEGTTRIAATPGGLKFARTELAPASADFPAFLFSSYPTDQSNRSRCELGWRGEDTTLPENEDLWIAMRLWYDFDMGPSPQHVTIAQIYHGGVNSGLNPQLGIHLYADSIKAEFRHCAVVGMTQANQILVTNVMSGLPALKRGQWFDIVVKLKLDWDPAGSGYAMVWVDGDLLVNYTGPIGYRGPALVDGVTIPLAPEMRFGNYPGQITQWTPDTTRDVYIRRAFLWRNVGAYTIDQVRAALTA